MGFIVKYCDECRKRIPEEDLVSGQAVEYGGHIYCKKHIPEAFKVKTSKVQSPTKKVSKVSKAHRISKTTNLKRVHHSANVAVKRRETQSRRNKNLESPWREQKPDKKSSSKLKVHKVGEPKESTTKLKPLLIIIALIGIVGSVSFFAFSGSSTPDNPENTNIPENTNAPVKIIDETPKDDDSANKIDPKKVDPRYEQWIENFDKINEDYVSVLNNPDLEISSEELQRLAFQNYKTAIELQESLEDEDLAALISKEHTEKLNQYFIPTFGEYAAEPICEAVLEKTDKLLKDYNYEEAVNYLASILEGEREDEFPKILINSVLISYRKINNKFTEISSIYEINQDMITVNRNFRPIELAVKQFQENIDLGNNLREDWEKAKKLLMRIFEFVEKNNEAYENTESRFEIKSRVNDLASELVNYGYEYYMNLIQQKVSSRQPQAILDILKVIENDADFMSWLEQFNPNYHSIITRRIEQIKIEMESQSDPNNDINNEAVKKADLSYRQVYSNNIMLINRFIAEKNLNSTDIKKDIDEVLLNIQRLLSTHWISEILGNSGRATIEEIENKLEQKIFNWFYSVQNQANFSKNEDFETWIAFGIILRLIWKPEESRFGTNINKVLEKYLIEYNEQTYIKTFEHLKILSNVGEKNQTLSIAIGNLWHIVWEYIQIGKTILANLSRNQQRPSEDFMNTYRLSLNHNRNIIIAISNNRHLITNANIARSLVDKTQIMIDWHKDLIAEAERSGRSTTEETNILNTLTNFIDYLKNYE